MSERPLWTIAAMAAAMRAQRNGPLPESVRGLSIDSRSIAELRKGDVLLIAGKGHETGQIIGNQTLPFSDHEAVAAALQRNPA